MIPDHAELSALYDLWHEVHAGVRLPSRGDFPTQVLRPWFGHLAILRVLGPEQRLRVDLVGTAIVELDGRDSTGCVLDEVVPPHAVDTVLAPYRELLSKAQPVYHRYPAPDRPMLGVHRLLLPLGEDGESIDRILSGVYADEGLVAPDRNVFDLLPPRAPATAGAAAHQDADHARPSTSCIE
jgi:hypothetical protein